MRDEFEEKASWWQKKGFYMASGLLLIGVIALGAVFYRQNDPGNSEMLADIATEVPEQESEEIAQANANVTPYPTASATTEAEAKAELAKEEAKQKAKEARRKAKQKAKEAKEAAKIKEQKSKETSAVVKHHFNEENGLLWPVKGDVLLKYSMDKTIYFKTLAQYKYNPGLFIGCKKGQDVKAAASGTVVKVENNDDYGKTIKLDIGDSYSLLYGQIKDVKVKEGDEVKVGQVVAKVAKPTKYYADEGTHLYFQVSDGKDTVDPLLLLQ